MIEGWDDVSSDWDGYATEGWDLIEGDGYALQQG